MRHTLLALLLLLALISAPLHAVAVEKNGSVAIVWVTYDELVSVYGMLRAGMYLDPQAALDLLGIKSPPIYAELVALYNAGYRFVHSIDEVDYAYKSGRIGWIFRNMRTLNPPPQVKVPDPPKDAPVISPALTPQERARMIREKVRQAKKEAAAKEAQKKKDDASQKKAQDKKPATKKEAAKKAQ